MSASRFVYLFKKHPFFRFGIYIGSFLAVVLITFIVIRQSNRKPYINHIDPSIGSPGDVLYITGEHFGKEADTSFVEIGGSRLTGSSYMQWTDSEIVVTLPFTVEDGLVYVVTESGRSEPRIFSNKSHIPVKLPPNPQVSMPVLQEVSEKRGSIGSIISIQGKNFGPSRNVSQVVFTGKDDKDLRTIQCDEEKFEYDFWSDQEIRVRVPDGAVSGSISVVTEKGKSNEMPFEVFSSIGVKTYSDKREYTISVSVDIKDIQAEKQSSFWIRIPRPPVSAAQAEVQFAEVNLIPQPLDTDFMNSVLYQVGDAVENSTKNVDLSYVIMRYAIQTKIQAAQVKPFTDTKNPVYVAYTKSSELVPSDNEVLIKMLPSIIGKEKNPYLQAKAIYNWLINTVQLLPALRSSDANPVDVLNSKQGDAYDFAILFTALCRASRIPALPVSGVLVDKNQHTRPHWWAEFYLENYGWVPVDPALGAGLEYEAFQEKEKRAEFYFGNLDSQHIMFSRDWNAQKALNAKSKTVYRPKTYAFQSIWEETSAEVKSYSSYWSDPKLIGLR